MITRYQRNKIQKKLWKATSRGLTPKYDFYSMYKQSVHVHRSVSRWRWWNNDLYENQWRNMNMSYCFQGKILPQIGFKRRSTKGKRRRSSIRELKNIELNRNYLKQISSKIHLSRISSYTHLSDKNNELNIRIYDNINNRHTDCTTLVGRWRHDRLQERADMNDLYIEALNVFQLYDKNDTGLLTHNELEHFIAEFWNGLRPDDRHWTEDEVEERMEKICQTLDPYNTNQISFNTFRRWFVEFMYDYREWSAYYLHGTGRCRSASEVERIRFKEEERRIVAEELAKERDYIQKLLSSLEDYDDEESDILSDYISRRNDIGVIAEETVPTINL